MQHHCQNTVATTWWIVCEEALDQKCSTEIKSDIGKVANLVDLWHNHTTVDKC